jgi:hypothetical protein
VDHAHDAIQIVTNYDVNIVCPLLLQVFFHLNLVRAIVDQLIVVEDEDLFFGQIVSNDDVIMSTLKNELQLYQQLVVRLVDIENLLIWWAKHVMQFSHVSFLAHQVLGIVGSKIKIEWIFNVVGVITNLK